MRAFSLSLTLSIALGCAASLPARPALAPAAPAPTIISDATYDEALRHFRVLAPDAAGREPMRARLVQHLLAKVPALIAENDYAAVVEQLAAVSDLFTPGEIAAGRLPAGLEPLARYLYERGSPRGDEARVLSALTVLRSIHPKDERSARLYDRIKGWGFDSRAALSAPLDRFEEGLVDVWQEHARLTPTPEVLSTLARLYLERRNALVAMFQSSEQRVPLSAAVFDGVQRTAMSVAAVYLRHGDIGSALSNVRAMGSSGGIEQRLGEFLQQAKDDGSEGAGALLDLNRAYLEYGLPEVSRALCLVGLRQNPSDARFPQCLAQIAAIQSDFGGAMAWYSEAVRLLPEERGLYDEILEVLSRLMDQGFSSDPAQTQLIASRAVELLQERMKRWPDAPLAVRPEDLYLAIGVADMNAGDAVSAEARLRKSLETKPTLNGCMQLGILLERMNRGAEAAGIYGRALQLADDESSDGDFRRAEILERLGDTLRMLGKRDEATRMYEKGLALWDQNLSRQKGQRIGLAQLRRGVLLGRLARPADSMSAFKRAMEFAPEARETYATILAYLAVSQPDGAFAHEVFHNALNQLSLEPEWKVYFALWLRMIVGRAGQSMERDVAAMFQDLAKGDDWWASLAQFAAGELRFEALLSEASDLGERAEAYFYEGARRLGEGDDSGARAMFQRVLESQMVNFYEYAMAQELMSGLPAANTTASSPPPAQSVSRRKR
jgi:tetratricopeptide (TPR) repeat protein